MNLRIDVNIAQLNGFLLRAAASRPASWLLLCVFFWIVAAASFSGFVGKWGFLDESQKNKSRENNGLEAMLDTTAEKPYVYRQLVPMLSNFADRLTPEKMKEYVTTKIKPEETFARTTSVTNPKLRFRYLVIYYSNFFSLFLSLFVLRRILHDFGIGSTAEIVAPTSLVLGLPYLQTVGGYFYDSIELFFASLAFLIAMQGRILLLITLALPATLNKETFIFFLPTLYPLLRQKLSSKLAFTVTFLAILAAVFINVLLKLAFLDAQGEAAQLHFLSNIKSYLMPSTYLHLEDTYGIVGPEGAFFGTIAVITIIVLRSWAYAPPIVRQHLLIAAVFNFPLFLIFCATGELRNLSLLFVGFVILVALEIDRDNNRGL